MISAWAMIASIRRRRLASVSGIVPRRVGRTRRRPTPRCWPMTLRLLAGLDRVVDGLVVLGAPAEMVGEQLYHVVEPARVDLLDARSGGGVVLTAPPLQQPGVDDVLRERVLEAPDRLVVSRIGEDEVEAMDLARCSPTNLRLRPAPESRGISNLRPMTAAVCRVGFRVSGRRSTRAAMMSWIVEGTAMSSLRSRAAPSSTRSRRSAAAGGRSLRRRAGCLHSCR